MVTLICEGALIGAIEHTSWQGALAAMVLVGFVWVGCEVRQSKKDEVR